MTTVLNVFVNERNESDASNGSPMHSGSEDAEARKDGAARKGCIFIFIERMHIYLYSLIFPFIFFQRHMFLIKISKRCYSSRELKEFCK